MQEEGKGLFFLKNRSNYTLPAPSATQAESTPKIKYTLHLGTNSRNKMHSVKNRAQTAHVYSHQVWVMTSLRLSRSSAALFFLFSFFFHRSKLAANQTDRGFNCHWLSGFILNSKCVTLTLRATINVTQQWRSHLLKRFSSPMKCDKSGSMFCNSFSARCLNKNKEPILPCDYGASMVVVGLVSTKNREIIKYLYSFFLMLGR